MEGGPDPDCRRGMLWDENRQDRLMLEWYQKLIAVRKENPALLDGTITEERIDDENGTLFITRELEGTPIHLLYHFRDGQVNVPEYEGKVDLLTGKAFSGTLEGYEAVVLK